jgi:hypothetical protein
VSIASQGELSTSEDTTTYSTKDTSSNKVMNPNEISATTEPTSIRAHTGLSATIPTPNSAATKILSQTIILQWVFAFTMTLYLIT